MRYHGRQMTELSRWPSGGNRRDLEAAWLDSLERLGLPASLIDAPTETPAALRDGVDQFNRRQYWECHETLEELWRATPYPLRFFYHALIKVAVGFHHLSGHNLHGARGKMADGVRLLELFQPVYLGIRTETLLQDSSAWLSRLAVESDVDWAELDLLPRPTISMGLHRRPKRTAGS